MTKSKGELCREAFYQIAKYANEADAEIEGGKVPACRIVQIGLTVNSVLRQLEARTQQPELKALDESKYAIIPLGYVRQKLDNGVHTGWTHSVRRIGNDRIAVKMTREFPEGPTYREPETFEFALPCIENSGIEAQQPDNQPADRIRQLIRETLDSPTFIDPVANCKNLTKCLQDIERLLA